MKNPTPWIPVALMAACLTACGSGGTGDSSAPAAPSDLSYGDQSISYVVQVEIEANVPAVQGKVTLWTVEPPLPAGLVLDQGTGTITGAPVAEQDSIQYVVTAKGPGGKTQGAIEIDVVHPARFAYVAGTDDTIGMYTVDAMSGALRFGGLHHHVAPDKGPEQVAVHPSGRFLFVPNRGVLQQDSTVTSYAVNPGQGTLVATGHAPIGEGPHRIAVSPSGEYAYGISYADHTVHSYAVDPDSGTLSVLDVVLTNTGPERLTVDPLGRFVYITHGPSADIAVFAVQEDGTLAQQGGGFNYYDFVPSDVAVDNSGAFAYFTFTVTNTLVSYSIDQSTGELFSLEEVPTSGSPSALLMHPRRDFAYVTSLDTGTIDVFVLDPVTGGMSLAATYAAGSRPVGIEFDPSGRKLYVLDVAANETVGFAVDGKDGTLTELGAVRTRSAATHVAMLRGDAPALPREEFLYVVNGDSEDVAGFAIDVESGGLEPTGTNALTGSAPSSIAVDPLGRYAWVANTNSASISIFELTPGTGELIESEPPHLLASRPGGLVVDPSGEYLYVTLKSMDRVLGMKVLPTGALSQVDEAATDLGPVHASVDPTGQFLYVSNLGAHAHSISAFRVHKGSFLTAKDDAPAPGHPGQLRFAPDGARAYVALRTSHVLVPYDVHANTGALTVQATGSEPVSTEPTAVSLTPDGRFAFAAVPGSPQEAGFVAGFAVDEETGGLSPLSEVHEGLSPRDLLVGPSGRYLYVANETGDDVTVFTIDQETGALTATHVTPAGLAPEALILATRVD